MRRPTARIAAAAVAALLAAPPGAWPARAAEAEERPEPDASMKGEVLRADGAPVAGARLVLVAMDDRAMRHETVTDDDGGFELESVVHGYYEIVFVTAEGAYVGNRILLVPPKREVEAEFVLDEFRPKDERSGLSPGMTVPGVGGEAVGVARLEERLGPTGWRWFRTGKGVAVLLGGGTLLIAGLVALAEDEEDVISPVLP